MTLPIELQNIFLHRQKSYKMVFILVLIDEMRASREREVSMTRIKERFLDYFQKREARSLPVDAPPSRIAFRWADVVVNRVQYIVDSTIESLMPILDYPSSGYTIGFKPDIYTQLTPAVLDELYHFTLDELDIYYAPPQSDFSLREDLLNIIRNYLPAKQQPLTGHPLAEYVRKVVPEHLRSLPFVHNHFKVRGSVGRGNNWATIPWIAVMYPQLTDTIQRGVYVAYLFSADMQRLYLTLNQGLGEVRSHLGRSDSQAYLQERAQEIREKLPAGRMRTDDEMNLGDGRLGDDYQTSTIAYFAYDTAQLPDNEQLVTDLWDAMDSYMFYIESTAITPNTMWAVQVQEDDGGEVYVPRLRDRDVADVLERIGDYVSGSGFYFPAQLTHNFYLSLKTRPFVILAGISGTGKTRLVRLFAEAIGATAENGQFTLIPVRPDWSDPAELIGYRDLSGMFQPGPLTLVIREASRPENRKKPYFVCLDEMNLARVEHYFSDMMSLLETQKWREEMEHPYSSPERRQEYVYTGQQDAKHMSVKRDVDRDIEHMSMKHNADRDIEHMSVKRNANQEVEQVNVNRSNENSADPMSNNLSNSTPIDSAPIGSESSGFVDCTRSDSSDVDSTPFKSIPVTSTLEERKRTEHLARRGEQDSADDDGYMDAGYTNTGYTNADSEDDERYEDHHVQSHTRKDEMSSRKQNDRLPGIHGVYGTGNEGEQQQRNNGNRNGDHNEHRRDTTSGNTNTQASSNMGNINTQVAGSARTPASGSTSSQNPSYRVDGLQSHVDYTDAGAENRATTNMTSHSAAGQGNMRKTERRIVTDPLIAAGMLQLEEDRMMYGQLGIPDNVYIVGTVNMDETTYPFSKRVLDRANTIEFHTIDLMQLPRKGSANAAAEIVPIEQPFLRSDYLQLIDAMDEHEELIIRTTERLVEINRILENIHAHVGYRIRDTICFYLVYNQRFGLMGEDEAFDLQLLQKILPRIQGSQAVVRRALVRLLELCLKDNVRVPSPLEDDEDFWSQWEYGQTAPEAYYPESARKLAYMIRRLDEDGFTSYWVS
ncbi:MrcB family domain-containing protein [Paenibacillus wenxiniae]|uniref:MrcB family domain-containing protein n=1 Tax=Paenibacillus wenxiniae TaxID=1636843 RepID=A0ABW4RKQ8_9BACL